jgi:ParB family chromosome partitioning protein
LAIDKAEASKLINVARGVPQEFVRAIGKAPRVGRPRWLEFAEAVKDNAARMRTVSAIASDGFSKLESDERFARALLAALRKPAQKPTSASGLKLTDSTGQAIGEMSASERNIKLILAQPTGPAFAEFLSVRLPGLYEEFRAFGAESGATKES